MVKVVGATSQRLIQYDENKFDDLLDRRKLARNFLDVVLNQTANVYSINAQWGGGKTWFLKFIEDECSEQKIPFIQFNVWETDYAKDPFQAIINELFALLQIQIDNLDTNNEVEELNKELAIIKEYANKFLKLRKRLSFTIGLGNPLCPINASATMNPDTSSLAEYEDMKNYKNEFIRSLTSFVNNFKTKLLIAIDELDRCRPDYAISTLEIIKHFFNIKDVVFILAVDKEQLNRTVCNLYGKISDTDSYLNKFVDIQYTLPEPNIKNFVIAQMTCKYPVIKNSIEKLSEKTLHNNSGNWIRIKNSYENFENELCNLCENFNLSLRDIDKLCLKLSIALPFILKKEYEFSLTFLIVMILLNIKHNEIYLYFKKAKVLADNADFAGRIYWSNKEFRSIYKKIYQRINDEHSYINGNPEYKIAKNLLHYCDIIDFTEDFS